MIHMEVRRGDLHLHTTASDGSWSPGELVRQAKQHNVHTIAVTDHDTIDGVEEAIRAGKAIGVEVIPGVEISAEEDGTEVHLLGYFIDCHHRQLCEALAYWRMTRQRRMEHLIERLQQLGYDITYEDVAQYGKKGSIGRPHAAQALVKKGYVPSVAAAFDELLAEGKPAYVKRERPSARQAIDLIHDAGGAAICAHPGLLADDDILLPLLQYGLDGIEVIHSAHSEQHVRRYDDFAKHYNVLRTGGSDCHGPGVKEQIYIGRFTIPHEWTMALKESVAITR